MRSRFDLDSTRCSVLRSSHPASTGVARAIILVLSVTTRASATNPSRSEGLSGVAAIDHWASVVDRGTARELPAIAGGSDLTVLWTCGTAIFPSLLGINKAALFAAFPLSDVCLFGAQLPARDSFCLLYANLPAWDSLCLLGDGAIALVSSAYDCRFGDGATLALVFLVLSLLWLGLLTPLMGRQAAETRPPTAADAERLQKALNGDQCTALPNKASAFCSTGLGLATYGPVLRVSSIAH